MKTLILALVALFAQNTFAHTMTPIKWMSNPLAHKVEAAAVPLKLVQESYKIKEISPAKKTAESVADLYVRIVKAALHKHYPITGDDGGYSFIVFNKSTVATQIERTLRDTPFETAPALQKAMLAALKSGLIVAFANGSGNNTMANIVAVMDPAKAEIAFVIDSNFGSDD